MWGINSTANKPPASCRGLGLLMWTEIEVGNLAVELDEIERADCERGKIARHHTKVRVYRWSGLAWRLSACGAQKCCRCTVLANRVKPTQWLLLSRWWCSFPSLNEIQACYFSFKPLVKRTSGHKMVWNVTAEWIQESFWGCISNENIAHRLPLEIKYLLAEALRD